MAIEYAQVTTCCVGTARVASTPQFGEDWALEIAVNVAGDSCVFCR